MNLNDFKKSLAATSTPPPADLPIALQALWQAAKGNSAAAHNLVQDHEGEPPCDWVHGYLHRQEGDLANAGYWYRRAAKPFPQSSLEEEWEQICATLLSVGAD